MAATSCQEGPEGQRDGTDVAKYKADQQKKGEILREIHKINIQIQAMERERATHIFSKRSDFRKDFSTLEEMNTKLTEERKDEQDHMKQHLSKTSHLVKRFRRELGNVRPSPEFVERLKLIMEEIEGAINAFKEEQKQKYEELLRGERTMSQDLQALERKFETWAQSANEPTITSHRSASTQRPLSTARDITKDLPPEVATFEKFLQQTGGHRGGWDEYDHGTFLKFRSRHKGRIVFLDHLKGAIPTRTEEEIREHETWYQEYLFLNEQKKDGIKIWREKREEEKEDLLTKAQTAEGEGEEDEAERRGRAQARVQEEKRERFTQLNSWKVQKELEKAMKEERKMREELSKAKKQEEEKKRQAEIRAQVEEFRRQREEEERFIQQQTELRKRQEDEFKRQESAREIVRFRSRDVQKLQEKLSKEIEKENQLKEKEKQLERLKNKVEVDRDPSRLLQPTAGWKSRLKDTTTSSGGGQVLHMPHRAVPNWRKT
ncbi:hypothetical protein ACOMHN_033554 [Nucella lapillus]